MRDIEVNPEIFDGKPSDFIQWINDEIGKKNVKTIQINKASGKNIATLLQHITNSSTKNKPLVEELVINHFILKLHQGDIENLVLYLQRSSIKKLVFIVNNSEKSNIDSYMSSLENQLINIEVVITVENKRKRDDENSELETESDNSDNENDSKVDNGEEGRGWLDVVEEMIKIEGPVKLHAYPHLKNESVLSHDNLEMPKKDNEQNYIDVDLFKRTSHQAIFKQLFFFWNNNDGTWQCKVSKKDSKACLELLQKHKPNDNFTCVVNSSSDNLNIAYIHFNKNPDFTTSQIRRHCWRFVIYLMKSLWNDPLRMQNEPLRASSFSVAPMQVDDDDEVDDSNEDSNYNPKKKEPKGKFKKPIAKKYKPDIQNSKTETISAGDTKSESTQNNQAGNWGYGENWPNVIVRAFQNNNGVQVPAKKYLTQNIAINWFQKKCQLNVYQQFVFSWNIDIDKWVFTVDQNDSVFCDDFIKKHIEHVHSYSSKFKCNFKTAGNQRTYTIEDPLEKNNSGTRERCWDSGITFMNSLWFYYLAQQKLPHSQNSGNSHSSSSSSSSSSSGIPMEDETLDLPSSSSSSSNSTSGSVNSSSLFKVTPKEKDPSKGKSKSEEKSKSYRSLPSFISQIPEINLDLQVSYEMLTHLLTDMKKRIQLIFQHNKMKQPNIRINLTVPKYVEGEIYIKEFIQAIPIHSSIIPHFEITIAKISFNALLSFLVKIPDVKCSCRLIVKTPRAFDQEQREILNDLFASDQPKYKDIKIDFVYFVDLSKSSTKQSQSSSAPLSGSKKSPIFNLQASMPNFDHPSDFETPSTMEM